MLPNTRSVSVTAGRGFNTPVGTNLNFTRSFPMKNRRIPPDGWPWLPEARPAVRAFLRESKQ